MTKARNNNYDKLLDPEILLAERLQKRLETLKALKKEVMMTDVQAITELKRYNQPPDGVYQIMACTLLLLGHPPWEIDVRTANNTYLCSFCTKVKHVQYLCIYFFLSDMGQM